jgi:hypothetical protein
MSWPRDAVREADEQVSPPEQILQCFRSLTGALNLVLNQMFLADAVRPSALRGAFVAYRIPGPAVSFHLKKRSHP